MDREALRKQAHDADVTVWVGKAGIDPVIDELKSQLDDTDVVKVKFLRSARGGTSTEALAKELGDLVEADLVETRGNTALYH